MTSTKDPLTSTSGNTSSDVIGLVMLLGCSAALLGHLYILKQIDTRWLDKPVSGLSQAGQAWQHAIVLAIFGLTQALLAFRVNYRNAGALTRGVQVLSLINSVLIGSLGYIFLLPDNSLHTGVLVIIASLTGVIMACLWARRIITENQRHATLVHGIFLLLWLLLVPVFFLVDPDMIGAYQRAVGCVYLLWLGTLALFFKIIDLPAQRNCNTAASMNYTNNHHSGS